VNSFASLEEAYNLRDLGGVAVQDGRTVRRGMVFRSASLAGLTGAHEAMIVDMGVRLIMDFRSNSERAHRPSGATIRTWSRDYGDGEGDGERMQAWKMPDLTADHAIALMVGVYRILPEQHADTYAELFRRLAAGETPLLFHCTAGKDRTGVAAALLLELLGASREAIQQDYLRTNATLSQSLEGIKASLANMGISPRDDAAFAPILEVRDVYLEAMFDHVESAYGSVLAYATKRLELTSAEIDAVRRNLLA
jgi:protein-tyrosine phosphatase